MSELFSEIAGINVGHSLYVLRCVAEDLTDGFKRDATERRVISASKDEIAAVVASLSKMLGEIEAADTCQVERKSNAVY